MTDETESATEKRACGKIKELSEDHKKVISAEQKITDLTTVVRELIENSIDAGATNIEVSLTDFGARCIEVEDNGSGIDAINFQNVAKKHCTSKISSLENLQTLQTFGFRGEALSCLCALAKVSMITRSKNSAAGSQLFFNSRGELDKFVVKARNYGTTVIVSDLFYPTPIRKRDLQHNSKRHFDLTQKMLYEYILARPEIKFTLSKKSGPRKEKEFVHGGSTLEGCLITMFSTKTFNTLVPFKQIQEKSRDSPCDLPVITKDSIEELRFFGTKNKDTSSISSSVEKSDQSIKFNIHGYISNVSTSSGRNSSENQYFFINKKPCSLENLRKAINDVYRIYNKGQYPFVCLHINVPESAADFNVANKRHVLLQDESKLIDIVRDSLNKMFCFTDFTTNQKINEKFSLDRYVKATSSDDLGPKHDSLKNGGGSDVNENKNGLNSIKCHPLVAAVKRSCSQIPRAVSPILNDGNCAEDTCPSSEKFFTPPVSNNPSPCGFDESRFHSQTEENKQVVDIETQAATRPMSVSPEMPKKRQKTSDEPVVIGFQSAAKLLEVEVNHEKDPYHYDQSENSITFDLLAMEKCLEMDMRVRRFPNEDHKYRAGMLPEFNSIAEEELKMGLNRDSFAKMQVIGQFNRGFIITQYKNHLFIVDQHASDERNNYEQLLAKPPLTLQPLVHPQQLFLNSIQEKIVSENWVLFKKKGLYLRIDHDKKPGMRVSIETSSICQDADLTLTREDVEEFINVITDSPNQAEDYTLSKVKTLIASKACRKSVMIGTSLTEQKMKLIISNMGKQKNPWACAHGRPTIRHLMSLEWATRRCNLQG